MTFYEFEHPKVSESAAWNAPRDAPPVSTTMRPQRRAGAWTARRPGKDFARAALLTVNDAIEACRGATTRETSQTALRKVGARGSGRHGGQRHGPERGAIFGRDLSAEVSSHFLPGSSNVLR